MLPSGNPHLIQQISAEMAASSTGTIPFSDFMRQALYTPEHGYYTAATKQRVGRSGDFYTSVSVGECFGKLLAAHFLKNNSSLNQVVEQGANDGQLAHDLLQHLPAGIDYVIIEPHPALRELQQQKLGDQARWVDHLEEIENGITGQFICNELLDAFPVQRVQLVEGQWREIHIDRDFQEIPKPFSSTELAEEAEKILTKHQYPEGYTTELHLDINHWAKTLHNNMHPGARATIIDYGHSAEDYYSEARNDGTLRGYRDHKQVTDYYEQIGNTDLTASVNFTRLAKILNAGETVDQHHFLIEAAKPWLSEIESTGKAPDEKTQKLLRQFNTLIHPAMLGQSFKVLESPFNP